MWERLGRGGHVVLPQPDLQDVPNTRDKGQTRIVGENYFVVKIGVSGGIKSGGEG